MNTCEATGCRLQVLCVDLTCCPLSFSSPTCQDVSNPIKWQLETVAVSLSDDSERGHLVVSRRHVPGQPAGPWGPSSAGQVLTGTSHPDRNLISASTSLEQQVIRRLLSGRRCCCFLSLSCKVDLLSTAPPRLVTRWRRRQAESRRGRDTADGPECMIRTGCLTAEMLTQHFFSSGDSRYCSQKNPCGPKSIF